MSDSQNIGSAFGGAPGGPLGSSSGGGRPPDLMTMVIVLMEQMQDMKRQTKNEMDNMQKHITDMEMKFAHDKDELAKIFNEENDKMQNRTSNLESRVLTLENEKNELQQRILNLENKLDNLETENLALNTRIVKLEMNPNIRESHWDSDQNELIWCKSKILEVQCNHSRLLEEHQKLLQENEKLWIEINELKANR